MPLSRRDFGVNPNAGAPRNVANGWVGVWPGGVPRSRLGTARFGGIAVTVQRGLVELVETLGACSLERGYKFKPGQCWGYANRPIRGTRVPSNHSRGKALDFNSLANPMQASFRTDIPPAVVADWEACGFYWGGRYLARPDAMHFEYIGRPEDVAKHLAKATAILAKLRDEPASEWRKRVDAEPGKRAVAKGDQGDDVAFLRRWLGVEPVASVKFDDKLADKVRRYQRMRGIKVDGKVGPATWAHILERKSS